MDKYIIALDQGTTSSRAIIFDKKSQVIGISQTAVSQIYPQSGWVEQNPLTIYSTQVSMLNQVIAEYNVTPQEIATIGLTNQRETTIIWDRLTGEPIYNAIVWQCRRTAAICHQINEDEAVVDYIKQTTGLRVDPYFSATKIKWLLDNVDGAREKANRGELLFGTVDTWLIWKLTNGQMHKTDYTNASRTMLFDIHNLYWDKKLLAYFDIPESMLPEVQPSSSDFGKTTVLGTEINITGVAGDQQAALFGQCCFNAGDMKNTYGTGCFLLMNTGNECVTSKHGLITTIAATSGEQPQYALEGSVFSGGATIQWLQEELGLFTDAKDSDRLALSVSDTEGVYVVPAFTGLGAPYWDVDARGMIIGITRGTQKAHIVRAALEGIAYQVNDIIQAMQDDVGRQFTRMFVDGGATQNEFLLQFQADISNLEIIKPAILESTALGAAYLAGLGCNYWHNIEELQLMQMNLKQYSPTMLDTQREQKIIDWHRAIQRALKWHRS